MHISKKHIVEAAIRSCKQFARSQVSFFEERNGFLGWENWLTVDIARQLNDKNVIPFYQYPRRKSKLDIYVKKPFPIAVEIKTNYIDKKEVDWSKRHREGKRLLPERVYKDAKKINRLDPKTEKLLFVSTCFDTHKSLTEYKKLVQEDLKKRFKSFKCHRWHNCSVGDGHNLLLELTSAATV